MQVESYYYFYQVAKVQSISKVAQQVHLSQPALSQHINKFEEELGYKLFKRSSNGVELTKQGEIVYKHVKTLIDVQKTMIEDLATEALREYELRLVAGWPISNYILPAIIIKMKEQFPQLKVITDANFFAEIADNIRNNLYDIGIAYCETCAQIKGCDVLGDDRLLLVANADFDIPDKISGCDLLKYYFVLLDDKLETKRILNDYLIANSCATTLNLLYESNTVEAVKEAIKSKKAISLLPSIAVRNEIRNNEFKIIELDNFYHSFPIVLIRKEDSNDQIKNSFIQALVKELNKVLNED